MEPRIGCDCTLSPSCSGQEEPSGLLDYEPLKQLDGATATSASSMTTVDFG